MCTKKCFRVDFYDLRFIQHLYLAKKICFEIDKVKQQMGCVTDLCEYNYSEFSYMIWLKQRLFHSWLKYFII